MAILTQVLLFLLARDGMLGTLLDVPPGWSMYKMLNPDHVSTWLEEEPAYKIHSGYFDGSYGAFYSKANCWIYYSADGALLGVKNQAPGVPFARSPSE